MTDEGIDRELRLLQTADGAAAQRCRRFSFLLWLTLSLMVGQHIMFFPSGDITYLPLQLYFIPMMLVQGPFGLVAALSIPVVYSAIAIGVLMKLLYRLGKPRGWLGNLFRTLLVIDIVGWVHMCIPLLWPDS